MAKCRHDGLLAALIAKLPAPRTRWPRDDRIAWLRMMAMAFDVVYGPGGAVGIAADEESDLKLAAAGHVRSALFSMPDEASYSEDSERRFYVDHDGFAMASGRPISIEDLPAGAILWDERTGIEAGDVAAILWRDIGTTRRTLPPGVTLRPAI
jgi:hypothetical protein